MPNMSSWSFLYRQPPGLLSQLIWPKGASAMTRLLRWNFAKAGGTCLLIASLSSLLGGVVCMCLAFI
jgi:hypothetical protein